MAEATTPSGPRPLPPARVASIDAGRPFLPTLVGALLDGALVPDFRFDGSDPTALADVTLLVPTRRAARAAADAILAEVARRGHGRAVLLPDIRPFGDVEEDGELAGEADLDLEPVIGPMERRLTLTRLVTGWTQRLGAATTHPLTEAMPTLPTSPAEAVRLADALATLMDQVESQGADWGRLATLVPEDHALYWQLTRTFLSIVTEAWPKHLAEEGREDPTRRRHAAVRATAERLRTTPPKGPVIAAGSTGSVPSTADLIDAVARLPRGVAVLPGLDFDLDEVAWAALEPPPGDPGRPVPSHPQYGLRLLLARLGVERAEVTRLGDDDRRGAARRRLLCEAMRPAETTERWRGFADAIASGAFRLDEALDGLASIEARHEAEEAVAVALALREALETPDATAALVTPDRNLARRVAAELSRFGLEVDDSAGRPLGHTPPGALLRLVGEVALGGFEPIAVASLLAHPLACFGREATEARRLGRVVELIALRGPRPSPGGAGLLAAFDEAVAAIDAEPHRTAAARVRPSGEDRAAARALIVDLTARLAPLEAMAAASTRPLADWITTQIAVARAVARDDRGGDAHLFAGEEGEALARALADLVEAAATPAAAIALAPRDWPGFLDALIGDRPVNRRTAPGARLFVLGPLEARLLSFDLVVLAGLDEGIWPISTRSDPWLSRPMRRHMALEAPERRIGLAAHDFVQNAAAKRVILARATRSGGTPTVPSRWLQRLAAVIGEAGVAVLAGRAEDRLSLARRLDRSGATARPIARPAPKPPVDLRPTRASVTEIETWIRDPYAIFARRILRLDPLDPIGREIGAAERGTFVHEVLAEFVGEGHAFRGREALPRLIAVGEAKLAAFAAFPELVTLWRARLAAIAAWWLEAEIEHGAGIVERHAEIGGRWERPIDGLPFLLTARADRVDLTAEGRVRLLDYKTGSPPSEKQVQSLLSPQLALETALVIHGGFDRPGGTRFAGREIAEIAYLHLSGGRDGGKWEGRGLAKGDGLGPEALAAAALERLDGLVRHFRRPSTGYPSRPRVQFEKPRAGPYDHLARVAEWAAGEAGEGGEA